MLAESLVQEKAVLCYCIEHSTWLWLELSRTDMSADLLGVSAASACILLDGAPHRG